MVLQRDVFFVATGAFDSVDVIELDFGPVFCIVTEQTIAGVVVGRQYSAVTVQTSPHACVIE